MEGKIIFAAASFVMALIFMEIGVYSFLIKKPMHFWSGQKISEEEITDVKKYNKANGIMWICFGFPYLCFAAVTIVFGVFPIAIIFGIYTVVGLFILILIYKLIQKKYFRDGSKN